MGEKRKLFRPSRSQYLLKDARVELYSVVRYEGALWVATKRFEDGRLGLTSCEGSRRVKVRASKRLKSSVYCDGDWLSCACRGHASYRRRIV